jgi:hypothetical protein
MGLPHSDEPPCVSPAIRQLKIQLNDSAWSSDKARGAGMRRLALAQLGSAGIVDDVPKLNVDAIPVDEAVRLAAELEEKMDLAAKNLEFEKAAALRDQLAQLKEKLPTSQTGLTKRGRGKSQRSSIFARRR